MSYPTELDEQQAGKARTVNENLSAAAPGALFGKRSVASDGTTWAYFGGNMWAGSPLSLTVVADGSVTLAEGANYIEATTSGTVVIKNGSPTVTGFTSGRIPIRRVTMASGVLTEDVDCRAIALQTAP